MSHAICRPLRRLGLIGAVLTAGAGAAASPAVAATITPGATPLWLSSPGASATCPTAADLSGEQAISDATAAKAGEPRAVAMFSAMLADGLTPPAVAAACDRPAAAAHRLIGPITGSSGQPVDDVVFSGQRGLVGQGTDDGAALRPGDELVLPTGTTDASLDLTVAAGDASSTVRVSDGGPLPERVQIAGTLAAPAVVVTTPDGAQRTVAVPVPAIGRASVNVRRVGARLRATLSAAPGALLLFTADDGVASRVATAAQTTLSVLAPRSSTTDIFAVAYDPRTRTAAGRSCAFSKQRHLRCSPLTRGLTKVVYRMLTDDPTSGAGADAPATPLALAPRASAARATKRVRARVTRMATDRGGREDLSALAGDVNGDGRPDGWSQPYDRRHGELIVSAPGGRWKRVRVNGADSTSLLSGTPPVVQDVTGDGRADLVAESGVYVADAFSGASLPASIDLTDARAAGPADLVRPKSDPLGLSEAGAGPLAGIADVTGDRRPELVTDSGTLAVYPSSAFPLGHAAGQAAIRPVKSPTFGDDPLAVLLDDIGPGGHFAPQFSTSYRVVGGRLFTVEAVDRANVSRTAAQPVVMSERRADGTVLASLRFLAAGWPDLLDVDPSSGDALVRLVQPGNCPRTRPYKGAPFSERTCRERIARVAPDGSILATVRYTISQDDPVYAVFANDGGDADARPEALVAFGGGLNPGPLHVLGSETTGSHALDDLPLLDLGGKRRDDDVRALTAVTSAAGARQVVAVTSPVSPPGERNPQGQLLIVGVR